MYSLCLAIWERVSSRCLPRRRSVEPCTLKEGIVTDSESWFRKGILPTLIVSVFLGLSLSDLLLTESPKYKTGYPCEYWKESSQSTVASQPLLYSQGNAAVTIVRMNLYGQQSRIKMFITPQNHNASHTLNYNSTLEESRNLDIPKSIL